MTDISPGLTYSVSELAVIIWVLHPLEGPEVIQRDVATPTLLVPADSDREVQLETARALMEEVI